MSNDLTESRCSEMMGGRCAFAVSLPYMVTHVGATPLAKPEKKTVSIDRCLLYEVSLLWERGIKTTGCCCGHGKAPAYISVKEEFTDVMKRLGYKPIKNELRPEDRTMFKPQTHLRYGTIAWQVN